MHHLLILGLLACCLLFLLAVIESRDFLVWFALVGGVWLIPRVPIRMIVGVPSIIVVLGEKFVLLILVIRPAWHHVPELHDRS